MITVSQIVSGIVKESPFLEEGLSLGVINLTALARKIKPQVDSKVLKKNSIGAIVMALQRLGLSLKKKSAHRNKIIFPKDITVRSNLIELTYQNSISLRQKHQRMLILAEKGQDIFFNILQGIFETCIIASKQLVEELHQLLKDEKQLLKVDHLASITLRFSEDAMFTPGVYYLILKNLAWEGVNVVEVISIHNELSLIVEQKRVDKAFGIVKELIQK